MTAGLRRVWICVNGINTWPGDAEGWTDRAVTWLHLHTSDRAEKFEYACGALTRRIRQEWRAEAIAKMAGYYLTAGYDVSFIAHSNGCDLVARVMGKLHHPVRSAHLFAAAADAWPFNLALSFARLGTLHLYGSPNDRALKLARLSDILFGWLGLGYGSMGLDVVRHARLLPCTTATEEPQQTHSSWFARGEQFERTMRLIIQNEGARA